MAGIIKSRLVKKTAHGAIYEYYVPELNSWINGYKLNRVLAKELGLSRKDWYDKNFLPKDELGSYVIPICQNPGCSNKTKFNGKGYNKYCCNKCSHESQARQMSNLYKDPESTFNSFEYREKLSVAKKKSWQDPNSGHNDKEVNKMRISKIKATCNTPEFKAKQSNDQINRWKDPEYRRIHEDMNREISKRESTRSLQSNIKKNQWSDCKSVFNSIEYRSKLSRSQKISQNTEEVRMKRSETNSKPEVRKRRSASGKELWTREDFITKQLSSNPFYTRNTKSSSNISVNLFNILSDKVRNLLGDLDIRYGLGKEYLVHTGKSKGDTKSARLLDFYIPKLNKWIEFYGDYWHKNPRCMKKGCNALEFANVWSSDRKRVKILSNILDTKPLIIWESDYKLSPNNVINKCINFIIQC